jgi:ABC-type Fe3+-hydroxamate transport system substrate-binding protein
MFQDAIGTIHATADPAARIVSLVPSLTELLCTLGLAPNLIGRTGFCVHPRKIVRAIPKVGGTKDVNLARLRELAPTHVIANIDENRRETVAEIARFVPAVVVTHPLGPLDNLQLYRLIGGIFSRTREAEALCAEFEAAYAETTAHEFPPERVLYLIWRNPWMTVAPDTYISRMLALVNWRSLPTEAHLRYPMVAPETVDTDLILLSSEPFMFRERHLAEMRSLTRKRVALIDGEMTSWYGPRAIEGMRYLRSLREKLLDR